MVLVLSSFVTGGASLYNDNHSPLNGRAVMALKVDSVIKDLEKCGRRGNKPDSPELLYSYLELHKMKLRQLGPQVSQAYLTGIIDLLLETICDPLVPYQWRALCLDNLHKPIFDISNLPKTEKNRRILRNKIYEVSLLTRHLFKHGGTW